jgi:hypothetical protein
MLPILEAVVQAGKPLLIIEGEALATAPASEIKSL